MKIMEKLFKNANYTERHYEATNIIFAVGESAPETGKWVEVDISEFDNNCIHLYTSCGLRFYGFL